MADATPATAVPDASPLGSKRKKVPGSNNHGWDAYLYKVLQDSHPGVKITKEAMQVWAEALDTWLQKLAQEIVQEHVSQALTPENVQASLQLLLAKGDIYGVLSTYRISCQAPQNRPLIAVHTVEGLAPMTLGSVDRQPFLTVPSLDQDGAYLKFICKLLHFCAVTHVCC